MLTDWIYWLSTLHHSHMVVVFGGLLLVDTPRYALLKVAMCLGDLARDGWRWLRGDTAAVPYDYCPSVCVVISCLNEAENIAATIDSIWGTYPRLEIMV